MMKHTLALAQQAGVNLRGVTTWAWMFAQQPYFANLRQLQTNGIHLPVLNAFKLLGALKGRTLPLRSSGALGTEKIVASSVRGEPDIDGMAAGNERQLQVILWNYHDDLVSAAASPVSLRVKVPPAFGATVRLTRLAFDETTGSSTAKWIELGKPAIPSAEQVEALKAAAALAIAEPPHDVTVENGEITDTFDLPRSGASLVLIEPPSVMNGGGGGAAGQGSGGVSSAAGSHSAGTASGGAPAAGRGGASHGGTGGASGNAGGDSSSVRSGAAAGCGCRATPGSQLDSHWSLSLLLLVARRRLARRPGPRSSVE